MPCLGMHKSMFGWRAWVLDCNALSVHQIWCGEGSFPQWGLPSKAFVITRMARLERSQVDFWLGAWLLSFHLPLWTTVITMRRASPSSCCLFTLGSRMNTYGTEPPNLTYRPAVRSRIASAMRVWNRAIKCSLAYISRANLTDSQVHGHKYWLI